MRRRFAFSTVITFAIAACAFIGGCATADPAIYTSSSLVSSRKLTYMVLPFSDATPIKFRHSYPNAGPTVRDAFETALLEKGFKTIPCPEIPAAADRIPNDDRVMNEAHAIELGKARGADAVIFGTVTAFYKGAFWRFPDGYTTVGFSVEAVDVKTTRVLWKASLEQSTQWEYEYDPDIYAVEVSGKIVDGLQVSSTSAEPNKLDLSLTPRPAQLPASRPASSSPAPSGDIVQ